MQLRRRIAAGVAAAVVAGLTVIAPTAAQAAPTRSPVSRQSGGSVTIGSDPTLLLVDLSGSMGDRDAIGRVKIAGARAGLNGYLEALPDGSQVGLRTYPSGDCGAGQVVIPIAELDRGNMGAEVRSLVDNDGRTPTAAALEAAGQDIVDAGYGRATIVLVSDGESNCGADPCDVARQLGQQGIDVTVNTVGFQISGAGRDELECIADATAGTYFDANDSDDLAEQLDALTRPRLTLDVEHPDTVAVAQAGPDGRTISVTATVRSVGARAARDVQLTFRPRLDSDAPTNTAALAVGRPRIRLGNIDPGGTRTYTWSFNPPVDNVDWSLPFTVTALADNTLEPVTYDGEISVEGAVRLEDVGPILWDRQRVVIMGDSFSSGEGAGSYTADTASKPNECHRSTLTYGMALFDPAPTVIACSGDTTADLAIDRPKKVERAQLKTLRRLATDDTPADLVLLTIGGNDIGFKNIIVNCLLPGNCHQTGVVPQCYVTRTGLVSCPLVPLRDVITSRLRGLAATLTATYKAIDEELNSDEAVRKRGGEAPIVVLAYPAITTDVLTDQGPCLNQTVTLSPSEQAFGRDLVRRLNRVISGAVGQARNDGVPVHFAADVEDAFMPDHSLCNDQAFVNPVQTGLGNVVAESFHPNGDGYRAMTAALVRWSNRELANVAARTSATSTALTTGGAASARIAVGTEQSARAQIGATYELTGTGFAPGSAVVAVLASDPRALGSGTANDDGTVTVTAVVPTDTSIGSHTLRLEGIDPDGGLAQVATSVTVGRPRPFGIWALAALSVVAAAAAAALAWSARHDKRPPRAANSDQ